MSPADLKIYSERREMSRFCSLPVRLIYGKNILNRRGYSLLEILIVLAAIIIGALLVSYAVTGKINEARSSALVSEARAVVIAARIVMLENKAANEEILDSDYAEGLTGIVNDASKPVRTRLSQRMNELLEPDVVLSETPGKSAAKVTFIIKDGELISLTYEKMIGSRHFSITISDDEAIIHF